MHAGTVMIWNSSVLDSMFHLISISYPVDRLYLLCYEVPDEFVLSSSSWALG